MKIQLPCVLTAFIAVFFLSISISHAAFVSISPAATPLSLTGSNGALAISYSPSPATEIWFSNSANGGAGDVGAQNQNNVGSVLESTFSLTSGSLFNGSTIDSIGGGSTATFTSAKDYDYLAVHFGKHELFFHFASFITAGTAFTIRTTGKAAGLSNFRSYSSKVSTVPVPAAVWLMGSGLVGLLGVSRKRKDHTMPA